MWDWLIDNIDSLLDHLVNALLGILNWFIEALAGAIEFLLSWLPDYTLPTFTNFSNDNQALTFLNWMVPVDTLVVLIGMWGLSEIAYIGIAPVLRWFKLIRG